MRAKKHKLFLFLFLGLVISFGAYAQITPLKKILEAPANFESQVVEIEGEVIGEPLYIKREVWVNILSEGSNMAVVLPRVYLDKIKHWGGYRESGDIVRIQGEFYEECPLHHETDIHTYSLDVVALGMARPDAVTMFKVRLALVLFIICLIIGVIYLIKSRYGARS